ncbi:uncharacterized protein [Cherax quadricarinatus]|uniref:uncharacterized protein isoform X2 n=1 Tax=Cherax quadricarinatus TaxID=27406 RepID=UPI00387E3F92
MLGLSYSSWSSLLLDLLIHEHGECGVITAVEGGGSSHLTSRYSGYEESKWYTPGVYHLLQVQEYFVGVLVCLHTCIKQEFPASFCASPCCSHYFNTIEEAKEAPAVKSAILPRYHHQYYQPAIWKSKHTCCTFHNVLHMCALLHNLYKSDPILQYSPTTALPCNMLQPQPHPAVFSNHSPTLQYSPTTALPWSYSPTTALPWSYSPTTAPASTSESRQSGQRYYKRLKGSVCSL